MSAAANHPDISRRSDPPPRRAAGGGLRRRASGPRRPGSVAMLFGLFGAIAAWFLQIEFGETVTAQVCYRQDVFPLLRQWLMPAVGAVTVGALLVGIAGTGIAWRNWRDARGGCLRAASRALDTGGERRGFLAKAGLLLSLLFLTGLVAAGFAVLLVSPCAWR